MARYSRREMVRALRRSRVSIAQFSRWAGDYTPEKFLVSNPTWRKVEVEDMIRENAEAMRGS